MLFGLLLILIFLSGFFTRMHKAYRFSLWKAVLLTAVGTITGMVFFTGLMWLVIFTGLNNTLITDTGSIFVLILLIAFIDGIFLYWIADFVFRKIKVQIQVFTLSEYIIQWSLIYITVYQVIYDNIFPKQETSILENFDFNNPSQVIVGVLPSLISVWIGLILYKLSKDKL